MDKKRKPLTPPETAAVEILARTDALFATYRDWRNGTRTAPGSIWRRCNRFDTEGVSVGGKEPNAAERMRTSRALTSLAEARLIQRDKPNERGLGARLTADGDRIVRGVAGLPGLEECFAAMADLRRIGETDDAIPGGKGRQPWIRETFAIGEKDYPATPTADEKDDFAIRLSELRQRLAPGLWRAWLESNSDCYRHACYRLTPAGLAILDNKAEQLRLLETPTPEPSEAAAELYWSVFSTELQDRRQWGDEPARNELGLIPLPASLPTRGELAKFQEHQQELVRQEATA